MARILVTGARRGIGREITLTLARAGHDVVATMRDPSGCDLADIAAKEGLSISLAALDVDDDASVAALFAQPGMANVDVLINNAGILSINALEDESMAMIQAVMNTNFFGPLRCMKAVIPAMRERRQGLIINLSSIAGRMAVFSHSAYGHRNSHWKPPARWRHRNWRPSACESRWSNRASSPPTWPSPTCPNRGPTVPIPVAAVWSP